MGFAVDFTSEISLADIAKHGHGNLVQLLCDHNIGPREIDQILERKNIKVAGIKNGTTM